MADIVKKFAESMPQDYDEQFFESEGSVSAPYSEYTLTEKTRENAVTAANYFRWLEGLSGFTASSDDIWSNAAKGAVLTQVNTELTGYLSHYPAQPSDMDSDFYLKGKKATTTSNIAYGFGTGQKAIPDLLRGFINDEGYTDIPFTFIHKCALTFHVGMSDLLEGQSARLSTFTVTRKGHLQDPITEDGIQIMNMAPMFRRKIAEPSDAMSWMISCSAR